MEVGRGRIDVEIYYVGNSVYEEVFDGVIVSFFVRLNFRVVREEKVIK